MKRIKLFENFNKVNVTDLISDIESIIYLLEDKEYRVKFFYKSPLVDGLIEWNNPISISYSVQNVDSATELVIAPIYEKNDKIKRGSFVAPPVLNNNLPIIRSRHKISPELTNAVNDFRNDMNIFINLLRDHLDYINPDKITLKEKPLAPPIYINYKYAFQIIINLI